MRDRVDGLSRELYPLNTREERHGGVPYGPPAVDPAYSSSSPSVRLLCLPCAGASATMYWRWQRSMPHWLRIVPLELPGRGAQSAQPFVRDFDCLVAWLCEQHQTHLVGQYALFGHSMGALLAYAIAVAQLHRGTAMPRALFVAGSPAPACQEPERFADKKGDAALIADLHRQAGTPHEVFDSPDLLRLVLDTLDADYRVCESFGDRAVPLLPVPIHVFAGTEDDIARSRIEAWARASSSSCSFSWFDGGHFFIREHQDKVIAALVTALRDHVPQGAAAARTTGRTPARPELEV